MGFPVGFPKFDLLPYLGPGHSRTEKTTFRNRSNTVCHGYLNNDYDPAGSPKFKR